MGVICILYNAEILIKCLMLYCNQKMNVWEGVIEIYVYIGLCGSVLSHDISRRWSVSTSQLRRTSCASCEVGNKDRTVCTDILLCSIV